VLLATFVQSKITKSRSDDRAYKLLTLENRLQVLLISDPETDKSAASMDVNVGSAAEDKNF
jgi:secreted Zn-dependent insulinase-like peptidase